MIMRNLTTICLLGICLPLLACSDSSDSTQEPQGGSDNTSKVLSFTSSDKNLVRTFYWAKDMALSYAHNGSDPVGLWYEAALPGRNAFCMRDVSHQTIGAEILGLSRHNANMMEKFAENISESKDWCSYWEIDKDNNPCSADYVDDANFWYNLNANFDVIFACWRLYEWTGDERYLKDEKLSNFYRLSTNEYVERWKLEPENMLLRTQQMNVKPTTKGNYLTVRGLPSYVESYPGLTNSSDLVASLYGGFDAYSKILGALGQTAESQKYQAQAEEYRRHLEESWWSGEINAYHTFWTKNQEFANGEGLTYVLWFNAAQQPERIKGTVAKMMERTSWNIENVSHFPLLWYRYGYTTEAYVILQKINTMNRCSYPEVSYGMIEGIVSGTMGIVPSASKKRITTLPKIDGDNYLQLNNIPMLGGYVSVRHDGNTASKLTNNTSGELTWEAAYMGNVQSFTVDGQAREVKTRTDIMGNTVSYVEVKLPAGGEAQVQVNK